MAKPNYAFEKRQRDLAKQKKKEEKRLKKVAGKETRPPEAPQGEAPTTTPAEGGEAG